MQYSPVLSDTGNDGISRKAGRENVVHRNDVWKPAVDRFFHRFDALLDLESIGTSEYFTAPQHLQEVKRID